jgi:hypothetical protein
VPALSRNGHGPRQDGSMYGAARESIQLAFGER